MLRNCILAACVLVLACTVAAAFADYSAWPPVAAIALLTLAVAFERARYRDRVNPDPSLRPTSERFVDPESGRQVQVWSNARGERHYVEEAD